MNADRVMIEYSAAWARGDIEAAERFYSDDVVMRVPGRGDLAGTHEGKQAVIAAIDAVLARTTGLSVQVDVLDRLSSSDRIAVLMRQTSQRGETQLEIRRVNLYEVRDGLIVGIDVFEANQYEADEFFG